MNILLSDEELIRIQILAHRCKGICEMGTLLHRLYSAHLLVIDALKKSDLNAWIELEKEYDSSDMGTR